MNPNLPEPWITLTAQDLFADTSQELASIVAIKGKDDRTDIACAVTEQVRDAYRSGGRVLGNAGTIPAPLKERAVSIALWKFITSGVPRSDGVHTKERQKANDDAVDYLNQVATRAVPGIGGVSVVSKEHRQFTRHKMRGL